MGLSKENLKWSEETKSYVGPNYTMSRRSSDGFWVLRNKKTGKEVTHGQYRADVAEETNVELIEESRGVDGKIRK